MSGLVKQRHVGSVTVLELSGRMTIAAGSERLNEKLQALIADGHLHLLLDCSQVSGIDSQGISALVRGVISVRKRGGNLKLMKLSSRVRQVLEITRLISVIESFDDEAAALGSFQAGVSSNFSSA